MHTSGSKPSAERENHVMEVGTEVQRQSLWSEGHRDEVHLRLTTFSYFKD